MPISYLDESRTEIQGLWLRSVRELFKSRPLFRIETFKAGKKFKFNYEFSYEKLINNSECGVKIDMVFDGNSCLRFLVKGCTLCLSSPGGGVQEGDKIVDTSEISQITNSGKTKWRVVMGLSSLYFLEKVKRKFEVESKWNGYGTKNNSILINGEEVISELAFSDGYSQENPKISSKNFDDCAYESLKYFNKYKSYHQTYPKE